MAQEIERRKGLKLKHFVLEPTRKDGYGKAARYAILTYADIIKPANPELANDLREWVLKIESHQGRKTTGFTDGNKTKKL